MAGNSSVTGGKKAALIIGAIALSACQTTGGVKQNPQDMLLAGVADKVDASAKRSAESPTCLKFYQNAMSYAAKPQGPSTASKAAMKATMKATKALAKKDDE